MKINPENDALIVVDVQNDFLPLGTMAIPGAEAILPRLGIILRLFKFANVHFLAHHHLIGDERSKNIETHHCGVHENIFFVNPRGGASRSPYGSRSYGAEAADCVKRFLYVQAEIGLARWYRKLSCPLFGHTFSVIHAVPELEQRLFRGSITRIFFAGLNFEYCIRNEIAYLAMRNDIIRNIGRPELCKEIIVFKDLIKPRHHELMDKVMEEMKADEIQFVNSMEFMK